MRLSLSFAMLLACFPAHADSWAPPGVQVKASASGAYLVRMEPGRRGLKPAGTTICRYDAKAERYTRSTAYVPPHAISPVDPVLAGNGTVVALDEWAQVGRGVVLTVHAADGTPTHRYTLSSLLGEKAAVAAPATVSSTWWRCGEPALIAGGHVVRVVTYDEGELRVDLRDGTVDYTPGDGRCQ
ncbi:hypothetical protein [Pseudoxanthomonas japonensis]|nr:hypothetical protein [Pseudoxanthomonas japonensis]